MSNHKRVVLTRSTGIRLTVRRKDRSAALRILVGGRNWRSKSHPYWFMRNSGCFFTVQCMMVEVSYTKKR